jgi:D-alanyl-D-alanine carboxypeptidase
MPSLADLVPIPSGINSGLSACREDTMLGKFGRPGDLTPQCSAVTGDVRLRIKRAVDVGPFKVSGLDFAVASLEQIFTALSAEHHDAYSQVKTAGMLCVRRIKNNPAHYSNHSWGTAIDLYFGTGVVPQGKRMTQRGFLDLYEIFNAHGWFWGAGFSGSSIDTMHFELADQTVRALDGAPLSTDTLISAADYIHEMGYDTVVQEG